MGSPMGVGTATGIASRCPGIDLVAELREETSGYAAIRCKFRDTQGSLAKRGNCLLYLIRLVSI